jgi:hypothetical protein
MAAGATAAQQEKAQAPETRGRADDRTVEPAKQPKGSGKKHDNPIGGYLKSREGRSLINTVVRGVFGLLRKR